MRGGTRLGIRKGQKGAVRLPKILVLRSCVGSSSSPRCEQHVEMLTKLCKITAVRACPRATRDAGNKDGAAHH